MRVELEVARGCCLKMKGTHDAYRCFVGVVTVVSHQILRAYGLGDRPMENPNAYKVRRMLHKMYVSYRPEFWFWKIIIMARKFNIVLAGTAAIDVRW